MRLATNASPFSTLGSKVVYMSETFKQRMKRIRLRAGLKTQLEAANAIGCDRGNVGMWEAPSSPVNAVSEEYLFKVADAYRVNPQWINEGGPDDGYYDASDKPAPPQKIASQLLKKHPKAVNPIGKAQSELVKIVRSLAGQLSEAEAAGIQALVLSLTASRIVEEQAAEPQKRSEKVTN